MAIGSRSGQTGLAGFVFSEALRTVARYFQGSVLYRWRYAGPVPERLHIAPTDLRTADPTIAQDIYAGRFAFAGQMIDIHGGSVFAVEPPSADWARRLHGFGWLRHLRASDTGLARSNARAMVDDWIRRQNRHYREAWEEEVVARRVMSWLAQAPLVLEGCDHAFYRRFMRSLTAQVRFLRRIGPSAPPGLPRLKIAVAVTAASLSMSDSPRAMRPVGRWLEQELARQILPDGGHVGRNPRAVLDLLVDLLPLRQAYAARGAQPPPAMIAAIDRMMPMIRFFRHGDGAFARFNGMGDTPLGLVSTVLAYDDARGQPIQNASHSGYQRVAAGPTLVLVDTGTPPPMPMSRQVHASCLAFEMSVGRQRLIVNCGVPASGASSYRLSRTTAAHSTLTLNEASSCRFLTRPALSRWLGEVVTDGPTAVEVERNSRDRSTVLVMRHDGYVGRFGIIHERQFTLSPSGDLLQGEDRFLTAAGKPIGKAGRDGFVIRFHLHPAVTVDHPAVRGPVRLVLPDGEGWEFHCEDAEMSIEESIFFSDISGHRRISQIVLFGRAQTAPVVAWRLKRVAVGAGRPPALIAGEASYG